MAVSFQGAHFPTAGMLMGVRWSVASPLRTRPVEERMQERGVDVDHSTINRWTIKESPLLEEAFHRRKRSVWVSWRMDDTDIKGKGPWRALSRAVDKTGQTIDCRLTEDRDAQAAKRLLTQAMHRHGVPEKIPIDGSAAKAAAITRYNAEHGTAIAIRQGKYLPNIVEQAHRGGKRITRPMGGVKAFDAAQATRVGIERMHMIKKRQMVVEEGNEGRTAAALFYALAASSLPQTGTTALSRPPEQNLRQNPSACGLASCTRKRESRRRGARGLDARRRGHDVLPGCSAGIPAPLQRVTLLLTYDLQR